MTERYDDAVAGHYAAFRPPFHRLILERLIPPGERFGTGLDIGCGTGYSAVALAAHCQRVLGIDPSPDMLSRAQPHPQVTYLPGSGEGLEALPEAGFHIVTFAGSLNYTKSDRLRSGLRHVLAPRGRVLVYDFEIRVDDVLPGFGLPTAPGPSGYNHAINLSDWPEFVRETVATERLRLAVSAAEMAHLLLSDSARHDALRRRWPEADLFVTVAAELQRTGERPALEADLFLAGYRKGG